MTMTPSLRKFALSVHIAVSVGWIGAVFAYIAIVVATPASQNARTVPAAWIALEPVMRYVLIPLAFASLLTGLVMAIGTRWGLFLHYWVIISFLLTIIATIVLLTQVESVSILASAAGMTPLRGPLWVYLLHPIGGLLVLLVVLALNVYKPECLTPYGWRKQHGRRRE
ncbi:MAG: DUF2269 domain-containing protein [Chloroflexi bacterium]|nr:DUF2269 domain-containing protein [Chloroflexota bacterium]